MDSGGIIDTPSLQPPRCVASAELPQNGAQTPTRSEFRRESNCFKSAQWSPDGTCLVTNSEDQILRTFVLPVDLLETPSLHPLTPYAAFSAPSPIYATAIHPHYDLANPSSTLILHSVRDVPIRLSNPLYPASSSQLVASYPLVSPTTEKHTTPHALRFCRAGTAFLTGTDSLIALFDLSRPGEAPAARFPTVPSRGTKSLLAKGGDGAVGIKGIVSALDVSCDGVLAAGTLTREVGLYDAEGSGDVVALFSVAAAGEDRAVGGMHGAGVTQVVWSPCGRYLYVAERKSDGVVVYDVRVTGRRLGWLRGRRAETQQRMGIEVVPTAAGCEVWAGGTDGRVRAWRESWHREGVQEPFFEWVAGSGEYWLTE
ncbi:MAG: hypothetical protein M1821_000283 [Bathelium mastoideum]|nr:MAG: hypothetical protein M1821_000283 [Bathelium mastoideum]